jgi:Domain of unknown function (DUF4398)
MDGVRATFAVALLALVAGCAGSRYPAPVDRLDVAESAAREASQTGADQDPLAHFHLALAERQIALAKELMESGRNERAAWVLTRAANDAEVALALARENVTRAEAQEAAERVEALQRGSP